MNKLQTVESQIYNLSSMWVRWMLSAALLWVFSQGLAASPLPDSLLTRDAAYRYMFVDPGKSRDIIDDMRARKTLPEWKLDLAEGNLLFSLCLFNKALAFYTRVYKSNAVQANDSLKMVVLTRLIEVYDIKFDEKDLPRYTHELYDLAKSRNNDVYMAMALFMDGKRAHYQGDEQEGYKRCEEAVRMMQSVRHFWRKNNVLRTFYGYLAKMCFDDKRYDEALKYSVAQEKASLMPHNPEILCRKERNLYRVYAIRAQILMAMDRQAEADSAYQRCISQPVSDPFIIRDIIKYLAKRQRYEEMMPYLRKVKAILQEDGDTLSRNMMLAYYDAGEAYRGMNQYDSASHCYAVAARLSERLHSIHSLQLKETVHESIELEREVAKHERLRFYFFTGVSLLIIAAILSFFYVRRMQHRNRLTAQHIQSIMNYRYSTLFETNGKHHRKKMLQEDGNPDEMGGNCNSDEFNENLDEMDENQLKELEKDPHWKAFHDMDKQIVKQGLFRDPNFGRDDLVRLAGVDKNALAPMIHKYTGTNVPGYINSKRMEYAIVLIKIHPEYTLNAIAEACGIKAPATFIRHFRNTYGMTPSEYRAQIGAGDFAPPYRLNNVSS